MCCSKKGLVDSQTGKTKRRFAAIQQDVLRDGLAGSKTCPLQISGAPIAGHGMSLIDMHACFVACIGMCDSLWSTTILFHTSTVRAELPHERMVEHIA